MPNVIEYDFILDGGRTNQSLILINKADKPFALQTLTVKTNADIVNPWGVLGSSKMSRVKSPDGNFYIYTFTLDTPFPVQPGKTKLLTYDVGTTVRLVSAEHDLESSPILRLEHGLVLKLKNSRVYAYCLEGGKIKETLLELSADELKAFEFPAAGLQSNVLAPEQHHQLINKIVVSCSVKSSLGPINVSMPPQQVTVQAAGNLQQDVPLTNSNQQNDPHPNVKLINYHASWGQYAYKHDMTNESLADINGLVYAFIGFDVNGNVFTLDAWGDQLELPLMQLEQQRRSYLQSALAFGGWTNAGVRMDTIFSAMAANALARQKFVMNVRAAVIQTGVKEVNIDWEYASKADAANFVLLLQELKTSMPEINISIAAPAGVNEIQNFTKEQWQQIASVTSTISVMTYDYFGAFSDSTDFHAPWKLSENSSHAKADPYFCIDQTLKLYEEMGVPKNKIALGFPNYARSMIVAEPGQYAGLYQPVIGTPEGDFQGGEGIYGWDNIEKLLNNEPSTLDNLQVAKWNYYDATHELCRDAKMSLLSGQLPNGQWVVMTFVDQSTAIWRAQQVMQQQMGGAMIWANYTESTKSENSIVSAISAGLNTPQHELTAKAQVTKRAEYLSDAWLAQDKRQVLNRVELKNDAATIKEIVTPNRGILGKHRNVFKRAIQWVLSFVFSESTVEWVLGKTKSLTAVDNLVQKLEAPVPTPTRTIEQSNVLKRDVLHIPMPTRVIERPVTLGKMPLIKYKAKQEDPISNSNARCKLRRLPCNRQPTAVLPKTRSIEASAPPAQKTQVSAACAISAMQQFGMVCNAGQVAQQQPIIDGRLPAFNPGAMGYTR